MDIFWVSIYCLIAVLVLFALTFHSEILEEKNRCDHLVKTTLHSAKKPDSK